MNKATKSDNRAKFMAAANAAVQGPNDISWSISNSKPPFFGWPVLGLYARDYEYRHLESRIVYANPFDLSQKHGLLRGIQWDIESTRQLMKRSDYELRLPAVFTRLKLTEIMGWLVKLREIQTNIYKPYQRLDQSAIRGILVQYEYVSSSVNVRWQVKDADFFQLNDVWTDLWKETSRVIAKKKNRSVVYENYSNDLPPENYLGAGYELKWDGFWL